MKMDVHAGDAAQARAAHDDELPLLRPMSLLALGAVEPDWDFLHSRLIRQEWELKQANWSAELRQTLQSLRTEHWDCLVVSLSDDDDSMTHQELASFLAAVRESGLSTAILVLASSLDVELAEMFQEYQCDFHEVRSGWFSPATGVLINRTMQLQSDAREKMKLRNKEKQRNRREQEEAEVILAQQRALLQDILKEQNRCNQTAAVDAGQQISAALESLSSVDPQYEQTLRSFVIMGAGRLENEISQLAAEMKKRGDTPRDLLATHLSCVEKMVESLGCRSSRHVVQKADQMLIEMMLHLAENYRCKAA